MCVKFGWKSASSYINFSKTSQGVIFIGHPVDSVIHTPA